MTEKITSYSRFVLAWYKTHKLAGSAIVLVILLIGYWGYGKLTSTAGETRYVVANVQKQTLVVSVTGSGQVSATNEVSLKPKVSGDVVYVGGKSGDKVKQGTILVKLDASDALKSVRDAQVSLESAQLALDKIKQPADELSLTQSENTLSRAQENKQSAETDLAKSYDDGFNNVSNAFLDLPTVMSGLQDVLFTITSVTQGGDGTQQNIDFYTGAISRWDDVKSQIYRDDAYNKYQAARTSYDKTFSDYKNLSRTSSKADIENIIKESYETTKAIADSIKSTNNLIQFYKDKLTEHSIRASSLADTHLTLLSSYTAKTNTHLGTLLNSSTAIASDKDAIVNAERTIDENTKSLAKLKAGADSLDLRSSELSVLQRQNALRDAEEKLSDYYIRAPFDGTLAKVDVKVGDSANSGTAVATFITPQMVAEISLNEVDAAKIKTGQKATLTFDAIDGLTITGKVAEVDTVGTVSQGVVSYSIKIALDTQDDRVKSGMTVSAAIVTDVRTDVLAVSSSAIKGQGDTSYVEVFNPPLSADTTSTTQGIASAVLPARVTVVTGVSNDTDTEITSGLKEGDQIVVRTITATTQTTTSAPSLFGGNTRGVTGGAVRATTGR